MCFCQERLAKMGFHGGYRLVGVTAGDCVMLTLLEEGGQLEGLVGWSSSDIHPGNNGLQWTAMNFFNLL